MLKRVLDDAREELLETERRLLGDLRVVLVRVEAPTEGQKALARSIAQLDELFLLVVVGEFNAGKSAVINALLGDRILEEGVTPTTSRIGLVRHGPTLGRSPAGGGSEVITLPLDILREITIVDTPGTNAVLRDHEAITREFVPRSDLVLFVTSADRPFTESERAFLEVIQAWGKKIVVVLNKVDILETPQDVEQVVDFVKEKVLALLGIRPQVFAVSARQARRAKAEANEGLLRGSGLGALEGFVTRTLNETLRVRLKLLNPVGVALRVLAETRQGLEARLERLKEDVVTLEEIEGQLALHRDDLGRGVRHRMASVESAVFDVAERGRQFLERGLRLGHVVDLATRDSLATGFAREVVADLPQVVEKRVDEIADWMVASEVRHWQGVSDRIQRRQAAHPDRLPVPLMRTLEFDLSRLLKEVRRDAQRAMDGYDHAADTRGLALTARLAAAGTAVLQVVALGLAIAVFALSSSTVTRAFGVLAAAMLSLTGFLLLGLLRRRACARFGQKIADLRGMLGSRLKLSFDRELEQGWQRARDALSPYSRFVRSEGDRLRSQRNELVTLQQGFESLKSRIESR
jgi:small GTP-binding protein